MSLLREAAKLTLRVTGAACVGAGGYIGFNYSTSPVFRRQTDFWIEIGPIIGHYYLVRKVVSENNQSAEFERLHKKYSVNILNLFTNLGGLYTKTGQYLSVRPEFVPAPYREQLKRLQSDVPGRPFEDIAVVLERELGPISQVFSSFTEDHIGAASIGQAHKATTIDGQDVVVKVMYPDAEDKFTADIKCIGQMIQLGQSFDIIKDDSMSGFYNELEKQFLAELDFHKEVSNLNEIRESTEAAYAGQIQIPKPLMSLSSKHVITMTFLEGPKLDEEILRRLSALGIKGIGSKDDMRSLLKSQKGTPDRSGQFPLDGDVHGDSDTEKEAIPLMTGAKRAGYYTMSLLGPSLFFKILRGLEWFSHTTYSFITTTTTTVYYLFGYEVEPIPNQGSVMSGASTDKLIDTLLDVHGFEIFRTNLFNADPHPGNVIVMENNVLGLIDYGQCKRISDPVLKRNIAHLIVSVAENRSDQEIATAFRSIGLKTKNDNEEFIAKFAKLMFGRLQAEMMDQEWHRRLRKLDKMVEFPTEMIMIYRVAALLRGISLSFQHNCSISEAWYEHAKFAMDSIPVSA